MGYHGLGGMPWWIFTVAVLAPVGPLLLFWLVFSFVCLFVHLPIQIVSVSGVTESRGPLYICKPYFCEVSWILVKSYFFKFMSNVAKSDYSCISIFVFF